MNAKLQQIHFSLQAGRILEAQRELKEVLAERNPRDSFLRIANLCRRADRPEWGARILFGIVNSSGAERAEYAACLIKLGAVLEGIEILKKINKKEHPEALLFQAYGHIKEWEYARAIPLYETYLTLPQVTESQKEIVKFNLAAALLQENDRMLAESLLTGRKGLPETLLDLQKLHALRASDEKFHAQLGSLRANAAVQEHWEFLRQCDLVEAKQTKNTALLDKVYFGSPFAAFKRRVGYEPRASFYDWSFSSTTKSLASVNPFQKLKSGSANSRLFRILVSDFYRPFQTARIGELLFKGEPFDPFRTPNRVQQAITRLRNWLKSENLLLNIEENNGFYTFKSSAKVSLRIPLEEKESHWEHSIEILQSGLPSQFDAHTAAQILQCSTDTIVIYLNRAIKEGICQRLGRGRGTRYCFNRMVVGFKSAA